MTAIDLMIQPGRLLDISGNQGPSVHACVARPDWAVAIHQDRIVGVDEASTLASRFGPQQTLNLPQHLLMPGLINAQSHALGIVSRGNSTPTDVFAPPLALTTANQTPLSPDEIQAAAQLAFTEMLLAGTTTCADMSPFSEQVAKAAEAAGIRVQVGVPITDAGNGWCANAQEGLERALAMHDDYAHHPRISIALGLPDLAQIDTDMLTKVSMYAEELNLQVQVLLQPTPGHLLAVEDRHGCHGVTLLERAGLLGPNLQAVHVNALDEDDITLLRRYRASLVRCPHPFANQMRPWNWMSDEQAIAFGTGSYDLNYYADLFRSIEGQGATGLHRATLGGARVLGLAPDIGALATEKQADLMALDMRVLDPRWQSELVTLDLPSLLGQGRANQAVTHVWVAGQLRVNNRQWV